MPAMPGVVIVLILLAFIVRVSISVIDRRRRSRRFIPETRLVYPLDLAYLPTREGADHRLLGCARARRRRNRARVPATARV